MSSIINLALEWSREERSCSLFVGALIGKEDRSVGFEEICCARGAIERAIAARDADLGIDHDRACFIQGTCAGRAVREARFVAVLAEGIIDRCEIAGDVGCDLGMLFDGVRHERKAWPGLTHYKIGR